MLIPSPVWLVKGGFSATCKSDLKYSSFSISCHRSNIWNVFLQPEHITELLKLTSYLIMYFLKLSTGGCVCSFTSKCALFNVLNVKQLRVHHSCKACWSRLLLCAAHLVRLRVINLPNRAAHRSGCWCLTWQRNTCHISAFCGINAHSEPRHNQIVWLKWKFLKPQYNHQKATFWRTFSTWQIDQIWVCQKSDLV